MADQSLAPATVTGKKPNPLGDFVQRKLTFAFDLGTGTFGDGKSDRLIITGSRAFVDVAVSGAWGMETLQARIFGMKLQDMNALASCGMPLGMVRKNYVTVQAGDDVNGMATIFYGLIANAEIEANDAPEVAFTVEANVAGLGRVEPYTPSSYPGTAQVATIVNSLTLAKVGYSFINSGVTATVQNHYMVGSIDEQITHICEATNTMSRIDSVAHTVTIWPKGGSIATPSPVVLSPFTNIVGYPTYSANGLNVTARFNPNLKFGTDVEVKDSTLINVNQVWNVIGINHQLSANAPQGAWFTRLALMRKGLYPGLF